MGAQAAVSLTPRQATILALLAAGETHKGVAMALYLSPHSVKNAVPVIVGCLGARNTTAAVVAAYQQGILDPNSIGVLPHDNVRPRPTNAQAG